MALTLRRLERASRELPVLAREMKRRVLEEYAAFIREELAKQHTSGRSIYGRRYPKPKSGGAPMFDTGELMSSYDVRVEGDEVLVGNDARYSVFLQRDGQHEHLPDKGPPTRWRKKLEEIKAKEARRLLRAVENL